MQRLLIILLPLGVIVCLAVLPDWNRTAADDQTVDFRLNQIMVRLNQIEWELSRVRNRQGTQSKQLDEIDTQLGRILKEMENIASAATEPAASASPVPASPVPASPAPASPASTDPALVGAWRLARHDLDGGEAAERIRRHLEGTEADPVLLNAMAQDTLDRIGQALDLRGLRAIRFSADASYVDDAGAGGIWAVYGDHLIRISRGGKVSRAAYLVDGSSLSLHFTREQTLSALKAASQTWTAEDHGWFDAVFGQIDGLRLSLTRDE